MSKSQIILFAIVLAVMAGFAYSADAASITKSFGSQTRTTTVFDFGSPATSPKIVMSAVWCYEDGGNGGCFSDTKEIAVGQTGLIFSALKDDGGNGVAGPNCVFYTGNSNAYDFCLDVMSSSWDGQRLTIDWEGITDRNINDTFGYSYMTQISVFASQTVAAPVITLTANPATINSGNSVILNWSTTNATSCTASGGWSGSQPTAGSFTVTPFNTTIYTLTCAGSGGTATENRTIIVNSTTSSAPTLSLTVNPTSLNVGNSSSINWTTTGATSCSAFGGWSGGKNIAGSETVFPITTTTYGLVCNGPGGSTVQSQTVTVGSGAGLPTLSLSASPSVISSGNSSVLSWTTTNITSCSAFGSWAGTKNTAGAETAFPNTTSTFTLVCTGPMGTVTDSRTITVQVVTTGGAVVQVSKLAKNNSLNETAFRNFIEAQSLDVLEFEILVRNTGSQAISLVQVRDQLPSDFFYSPGSTRINGNTASDGVAVNFISLGALSPGEEKVLRFQAVVFFGVQPKTVINEATINADSVSRVTNATVQIRNRGQVLGAGTVVTGPGETVMWVFVLGTFSALGLYVLLFKLRFRNKPLASVYADARFSAKIKELRKNEISPDT